MQVNKGYVNIGPIQLLLFTFLGKLSIAELATSTLATAITRQSFILAHARTGWSSQAIFYPGPSFS